ncbi:T9SS type A sorting domain-containing protein [Aquimarina pacifica]|uniref:hypothetical protein n=1 Tax=Aquimarina pacifica TaxID=1296415 RepID=UPI0004702712|nr:hypothetical protein [Aquimarina pacifica]
MKRVMKLSLIICAILLSTVTRASDVLSVKIENSSTINVTLSNTLKGQKLALKDYSGITLFDVTLKAMPSYRRFFDFKSIKDGIYFIESETEYDVKITPVVKNNHGVSLIDNSTVTIFKPALLLKGETLKVAMTRVEKSPLIVSIYDNNGALIFDEKVEVGEPIFKRTYNLADLPKGAYDVHFSTNDRVFIKEITL